MIVIKRVCACVCVCVWLPVCQRRSPCHTVMTSQTPVTRVNTWHSQHLSINSSLHSHWHHNRHHTHRSNTTLSNSPQ